METHEAVWLVLRLIALVILASIIPRQIRDIRFPDTVENKIAITKKRLLVLNLIGVTSLTVPIIRLGLLSIGVSNESLNLITGWFISFFILAFALTFGALYWGNSRPMRGRK